MNLIIVTPTGYFPPSKLRTGRPATHACVQGERKTLCGREALGWMVQNFDIEGFMFHGENMVSCKICLHIMRDRNLDESEATE